MAGTSLGPALKQIQQLFNDGTIAGLSDAELLDRYATRGDAAAFEALVQRHGPMVLAVCRKILRDPNDAEDAFQAAFLVLMRKGDSIWAVKSSLASWLYRVSYRIAIQANAGAGRRREIEERAVGMADGDRSDDERIAEIIPALHEEIGRLPEKYRSPVVLCHLEGMTHGEAARQLGWTVGMLRGRVARARELLRARLTRRGLALSGAFLVTVLSEQVASAAVPRGWVDATVTAAARLAAGQAAAGAISATAIALSRRVSRTMFLINAKLAGGLLLAVVVAAGSAATLIAGSKDERNGIATGAVAEVSQEKSAVPKARDESRPVPIGGLVVDSAGRPLAAATIYVRHSHWDEAGQEGRAVEPVATTGPDGRFRFDLDIAKSDVSVGDGPAWQGAMVAAVAGGHGPAWITAGDAARGNAELRLVPDDLPIRGRILDNQGRAVPHATVRAKFLANIRDGLDRGALLAGGKLDFDGVNVPTVVRPFWQSPSWIGRDGEVRADAAGRFEIPGVGRDQVAVLEIEGTGMEHAHVAVLARAVAVPRPPRPRVSPTFDAVNGETGLELYGASFEHVVSPSKPIAGVVRIQGTGRPVAGVTVAGQIRGRLWSVVMTTTDANGRFRLDGLPKAESYSVDVRPRPGLPCLAARKVVADTAGLQAIDVDFDLGRAVGVKGRVIDKQTGLAVPCELVSYTPLPGNSSGQGSWGDGSATDNTFRITVSPGPGLIALKVRRKSHPYPAARLAAADKGKIPIRGEDGAAQGFPLSMYHAYRLVDFPAGLESATVDLEVTAGMSRKVDLTGPGGRPVTGARVMGVTNDPFASLVIDGATFEVKGLEPGERRLVEIRHESQGLAGSATLSGSDPVNEPLAVRLARCGMISGRLIDEDGQPLRGATVGAVVEYRRGTGASDPAFRTREAVTDRDGRFRVEGINPTLSVLLWIQDPEHPAPKYQSKPERDLGGLRIEPGAIKEIGDVRVRAQPIQ
jgi:RNA polymerase sigma factor (sigma-70 family)